MTQGLITVSYIGASILFILSLGGLSNQETARRGNLYGIIGMTIAILATVLGAQVTGYGVLIPCMIIGGAAGIFVAIRVEMTQMPQLVAMLHSFVGLAAVLVGVASYLDPNAHFEGVEKTIHEVEIYLGVFIGAITFTGSVIAFGKLHGKIGGKPMLLPGRHWMNLAAILVCVWLGYVFLGADSTATKRYSALRLPSLAGDATTKDARRRCRDMGVLLAAEHPAAGLRDAVHRPENPRLENPPPHFTKPAGGGEPLRPLNQKRDRLRHQEMSGSTHTSAGAGGLGYRPDFDLAISCGWLDVCPSGHSDLSSIILSGDEETAQ